MIKDSVKVLPTLNEIESAFHQADLKVVDKELYFVEPDLEDFFLNCGKHNPEIYFREDVRNGISSFSSIAYKEEVDKGLGRMRIDFETGKINEVISQYDNALGDYIFLVGEK